MLSPPAVTACCRYVWVRRAQVREGGVTTKGREPLDSFNKIEVFLEKKISRDVAFCVVSNPKVWIGVDSFIFDLGLKSSVAKIRRQLSG